MNQKRKNGACQLKFCLLAAVQRGRVKRKKARSHHLAEFAPKTLDIQHLEELRGRIGQST
jgi:hypothetical protein